MRLKTVARDWQDTGNLTASKLDAIRLEIDHLLQETSSRWPRPAVPQDRRHRLAGRLVAMMIFGKAARLTADPQSRRPSRVPLKPMMAGTRELQIVRELIFARLTCMVGASFTWR